MNLSSQDAYVVERLKDSEREKERDRERDRESRLEQCDNVVYKSLLVQSTRIESLWLSSEISHVFYSLHHSNAIYHEQIVLLR